MFLRPAAKCAQGFDQRPPESREGIFNAWRNDWIDFAQNKAVAFEAAQRLSQHFLRNPTDLAMQFGVAHRFSREQLNSDRCPLIGDAIEDKTGGTL